MNRVNAEGEKPEPASRRGSPEKLATFVFGVIFLAVMLGVAFLVPNPSESQWFIFRVVLATAAAGAAVFLPGAVSMNIKPVIRATGALAVFALIYAVNPPKTSSEPAPAPAPAAKKYNLELKLTFSTADRLKVPPFEANVTALVNSAVAFSDYPGLKDYVPSNVVRRRQESIVVVFSDLTAGDNLSVRVEHGGLSWRSDDMRMPEANLEMNAVRLVPTTSGGQQ